MKRSTALSALTVCALAAIVSSAHAADGKINITGQVTDTTCLVNGNAPGAGAADKNVALNTSSVASLAAAGSTAGDQSFTITVGGPNDTGCGVGKEVAVSFDPSSPLIDLTTGRLSIADPTNAANAQNVQVEILDVNGAAIDLRTDTSKSYTVDASHTVNVPLIARLYATDTATAGDVSTNVGFQVVYP